MSKLHRSTSDKWIAGVCGGFAETYSWDSNLVRLVYILLGLLLGILPFVIVYIIAAIVLKKESTAGGPPFF